jgi:hypothetical protein
MGLQDKEFPLQQDHWKHTRYEGFEKLMQIQDRILQEHGGVPFTDSIELLYESREERDRELGIADEGGGLEARPVAPEMFEKIMEARERIFRSTEGQQFEDTTELIRQMREERTRELMERHNF